MAENKNRIVQITSCANVGTNGKSYVNVYGLDDLGRVHRWDPTIPGWEAYKVAKRERGSDF